MFVVRTSNPSKTSEKTGYFDRVKVSLHILSTTNQETERSLYPAVRASVAFRAACYAPARIWLALTDFQNGEQQSRSGMIWVR